MNSRPTTLILAVFLAAGLSARPADAATFAPDAPPAPSLQAVAGGFSPFGSASWRDWELERPHAFLLGGFALISAGWPSGSGWTLGGGGEFPMAGGWGLVPRVHVGGADTDGSGTFLMTRLSLDGRLNSMRGSTIYYTEAGIGITFADHPAESSDPFTGRREQQQDASATFVLVTGLRSDPNQGPAFLIEFLAGFGAGRPATNSLELMVGVEL